MKTAILYICTGRYSLFFEGFYNSCEKYFLSNLSEKQYFIFTDDLNIESKKNIHVIKHECKGFPEDSLFKFEMFLEVKEELQKFDYIFYFNANTEFLQPVGCELLPDGTGLSMGLWYNMEKSLWSPWRLFDLPAFYCYERNKKSLAYIPPYESDYKQFMGGLNGGMANEFLDMAETLARNIRDDYERGIIAIAHDQSHINAYLRTHPCKILPKEYCWPEEWPSSFKPKIIFRDKKQLGGVFLKGRKTTIWGFIERNVKRIVHAISWYL